jgi:hypothetical protein
MKPNININLDAYGVDNIELHNFMFQASSLNFSIDKDEIFVKKNFKDIINILSPKIDNSSYGTNFIKGSGIFIVFQEQGPRMTRLKIYSKSPNHQVVTEIKQLFRTDGCEQFINWFFSPDRDPKKIPFTYKHPIDPILYPNFKFDFQEFFENFKKSGSNILLLMGEPGTGKTNFIRALINQCHYEVGVTYDESILSRDWFFTDFIEGEIDAMVIEDADTFLTKRSEGNTIMHKFLNVGDGLVNVDEKKLIFSTNLTNTKEIDEALLRPGRCYSVLDFKPLNEIQAQAVKEKYNLSIDIVNRSYTLAELFNSEYEKPKIQKVGF